MTASRPPSMNCNGYGYCGDPDDPRRWGAAMSRGYKKNGEPWRVNRFGGYCGGCKEWIPAGMGIVVGSGNGAWQVYC